MKAGRTVAALKLCVWHLTSIVMGHQVFTILEMQRKDCRSADVIQWKNYSVVVMQNIFGRQSKSGIRNIAAKQDWRTRIC